MNAPRAVATLVAAALLVGTCSIGHANPAPKLEDAIVQRALAAAPKADEAMLRRLLMLEEKHGIPAPLRGMVLAAAWSESKFNPKARNGTQVGLLQQQPWWERSYGIDRRDPVDAADAWLAHIVATVPKARARCGPMTVERAWVVAWVTAIRAPRAKGRCRQSPKHWPILQEWRKSWQGAMPLA